MSRAQALPARSDITGAVSKKPTPIPSVFHARAELRMVGPNRIDIRLYGDDGARAEPSRKPPVSPEERRRLLNKALELQKSREMQETQRAHRAFRATVVRRAMAVRRAKRKAAAAYRAQREWRSRARQARRLNESVVMEPPGWSGYGIVRSPQGYIER
jgi:hypothetical protein